MSTQMPNTAVQDGVAAAETVPEDITIAIFCALSCEFTAVKHSLDEKLSCCPSNAGPLKYAYSFGRIGEHKIVIARPHQMGPVEAGRCAATVSHQFPNVRFALMVGIGAGIPNPPKRDIRLGDVAVGIPGDNHPGVLQYDFGKYEAGGRFILKGSLNKPPAILVSADGSLHAEEIEMAESRFLKELERITTRAGYGRPRSRDVLFDPEFPHVDSGYDCTGCVASEEKSIIARIDRGEPHVPAVHRGLILSGSGVIKNTQDRNMLSRGYQDAICYEMEAAGIVDEIPCLVIRGICDYADTHKQDGWHYYAAAVAAAYCKAVLLKVSGRDAEGQVNLNKEMKRLANNIDGISQRVDNAQIVIGELQKRVQQTEERKVLDWLTKTSYGPQQSLHARTRQPGTGQWILSAPEFLKWVQSKNQTLLCTGIPGSGKTILTSLVVEDLTHRATQDKTIGIAYIYFNFQQKHEQDPEDFFVSLLKQLAQSLRPLPADIKLLHARHMNKDTRPSWNEILATFRSVAALHSRIFIILDALDEASRECRDPFLKHIFNLQATNGMNVFATTRGLREICDHFSGGGMLEIRATKGGLRKYLDDRLSKTQCLLMCDAQKIAAIKTAIVRAVDGIFLSASLFVESLNSKICLQEVNTALQELETWSGNSGESTACTVYVKIYDKVMTRIMQGRYRELARSVLKWVTFARRPLTNLELRHAIGAEIAFRIGETRVGEDFLPTIEFSSICAGLISVDEETGVIQLVHSTTQEYFQRSQKHWFPSADENIASICVGYLSSPVFEHGPCASDEKFEARLQLNPLYDYAARFWGHHARTAPTVHPKMMEFLDKPNQVEAASQALMVDAQRRWPSRNYSQTFPRQITGLHLAAYFGAHRLVKDIINNRKRHELRDSYGRTALLIASENGCELVVDSLLEDGADVDAENNDQQTPLHLSAKGNHAGVVRLLLDHGANFDARDGTGMTPLHWAAKNVRWADATTIAELFLDKGANIEAKDEDGRTALHQAATAESEGIVELLIKRGANIMARRSNGMAVLHCAPGGGYSVRVMELLLQNGASVGARDKAGRTPLHIKAYCKRCLSRQKPELLLRYGSLVYEANGSGQTALDLAKFSHLPDSTRHIILEYGALSVGDIMRFGNCKHCGNGMNYRNSIIFETFGYDKEAFI